MFGENYYSSLKGRSRLTGRPAGRRGEKSEKKKHKRKKILRRPYGNLALGKFID